MKLLLDTQVILWELADAGRLGPEANALLLSESAQIVISVVSAWEILIKQQSGRLQLADDPRFMLERWVEAGGFDWLPVQGEHIWGVARLPALHGDPFDRLLRAQANQEGLTLLTADDNLLRYPGAARDARN